MNQGNEDEVEQIEQVQTPDILGKSIKEAEKILKDTGLEIVIENEEDELDKENIFVLEQIPKSGIMVNKGSKVYIKKE